MHKDMRLEKFETADIGCMSQFRKNPVFPVWMICFKMANSDVFLPLMFAHLTSCENFGGRSVPLQACVALVCTSGRDFTGLVLGSCTATLCSCLILSLGAFAFFACQLWLCLFFQSDPDLPAQTLATAPLCCKEWLCLCCIAAAAVSLNTHDSKAWCSAAPAYMWHCSICSSHCGFYSAFLWTHRPHDHFENCLVLFVFPFSFVYLTAFNLRCINGI